MSVDMETMAVIQAEKLKEVEIEPPRLDAETAKLSENKLFSIDVATSEVKVDPLR